MSGIYKKSVLEVNGNFTLNRQELSRAYLGLSDLLEYSDVLLGVDVELGHLKYFVNIVPGFVKGKRIILDNSPILEL